MINFWKNAEEIRELPEEECHQYAIRDIDRIRFAKWIEKSAQNPPVPYSAENLNKMEEWYLKLADGINVNEKWCGGCKHFDSYGLGIYGVCKLTNREHTDLFLCGRFERREEE